VAAGANLSFFPPGPVLRRAGAFFLRRSFGTDRLYTATFKAYVKKLVRDGTHQEFFPEGGRSRTGKLLPPKLGLLGWEVDAVLEGARNDLAFVPVSIDYEKIMEGGSYSKELLGGEKQAEDVRALISAPRVLFRRYGRIHLTFDEPILLRAFMHARGLDDPETVTEEQKRSLVRALGNRIMWGIARVSTVTPHALVSAALLSHPGRGLPAHAIAARVGALRAMAAEDGSPLSAGLADAPTDPTVPGPVREAMNSFVKDKLVRTDQAKGETMFLPVDERRVQLAYYKNTLMNLAAPRALVACAVLRDGEDRSESAVRARALYLSRLFKFEFIYRVDAPFETTFAETVDRLVGVRLLQREGGGLRPASAEAIPMLEFLADLLRDYLQSYLLAFLTLEDVAKGGPMDRKAFVRAALETGRLEFLSGRLDAAEAISRTTLENALAYLLDQRLLEEKERKVQLGPEVATPEQREALRAGLLTFIGR
jgi:glycerol-3-phosphate O-acyltransferase